MDGQTPLNPIQARLLAQRSQPSTIPPSASQRARVPNLPTPSSQRLPTPNRVPQGVLAPPSASASFPAINSAQRAGARHKVVLQPGCSPLDWAALNSSGKNLRGIDPRDFPVRVSKDLLKSHKTVDDCWTVLNGKVYNITPYLRFHPGGVDEIMKCAGKDGTSLFMKYHAWVNYERMLEKCLVGMFIG